MTQTLHYHPAGHTYELGHAIRNLLIVTIVINAIFIGIGAWDRSWGAIGMAFLYSPIANGLIALAGLAFAPALRHWHPGAKLTPYVAASVFIPGIAVGVTFGAIYGAMQIFGSEGC